MILLSSIIRIPLSKCCSSVCALSDGHVPYLKILRRMGAANQDEEEGGVRTASHCLLVCLAFSGWRISHLSMQRPSATRKETIVSCNIYEYSGICQGITTMRMPCGR